MLRLLCCARAVMGTALSHQEGEACEPQSAPAPAPVTMAEVIRDRKKKAGGASLATLRRRLAAAAARRPRTHLRDRGCRSSEHARHLRQLVSAWSPAELAALHEHYEACAALRDLSTQAELAREPAPTLRACLARLYSHRWCGDAQLVYRGSVFTVHRAILSARCVYFRDLLNSYPSPGARICLDGMPASLTAEELDRVLRAVYAGDELQPEWCGEGAAQCGCQRLSGGSDCDKWGGAGCSECCSRRGLDLLATEHGAGDWRADRSQLRRLAEELGFRLDSLQRDMRYLLDSGDYSDLSLVFSCEGGARGASDYGFRAKLELPCHRAVLASRSPFFRGVIARATQARGGAEAGACEARRGRGAGAVRVCVDERVLPRRFARALLHAAYTDQVDLSLISRNTSSPQSGPGAAPPTAWGGGGGGGGGGEAGGGASGSGKSSPRQHAALEDAFELYEIARFLEMAIVVQGCEDAIAEALSGETLPRVLEWASAPHASKWVYRQAMRFLRDEFAASCAPHVHRLPRDALAHALASPFLQASETQALRALLRWGERAARDSAEQREPNVVRHTAHCVSRKAARRGGGATDAELREAIAPLASLLRAEHAPPADAELYREARRRGLLATPPPHMVEGACSSADAWLGRGPYRLPRLFLPYYEESKALLEDQLVSEAEVVRVRRARYLRNIPDTLYMVAAERQGAGDAQAAQPECERTESPPPAPDARVVRVLRARARELRSAPPATRALAHPTADAHHIYKQIALRAVRELGLPDACAELVLADDEAPLCPHCARAECGEAERRGAAGASARDLAFNSDDECEPRCGCPRTRCSAAETDAGRAPLVPPPDRRAEDVWYLDEARQVDTAADTRSLQRYGARRSPARLCEAVPDVAACRALAHGSTHTLAARAYCARDGETCEGAAAGLLQLDLGDGATHAPPRHGSRALRAAALCAARSPSAPAPLAADAPPRCRPDAEPRRPYSALVPRPLSPPGPLCRTSLHSPAPAPPLDPGAEPARAASLSRLQHYRASALSSPSTRPRRGRSPALPYT